MILAAGKGTRFGGDKVGARLGGKPVWRWSFDTFLAHKQVDHVTIVCPFGEVHEWVGRAEGAYSIVEGGDTRQKSAYKGVRSLEGDCDIVLLHDAARPFVTPELIDRVIQATHEVGGAAPGVPVTDTLRNQAGEIVDRETLLAMQTPQGARVVDMIAAQTSSKETFTDDIALLQSIGLEPQIIPGDPKNFKITTEDDLAKARGIVGFVETRTGMGYDIHAFSTDDARPLMVGGVEFPGAGLEGHSDADALIHAIVDALLGAAALGDIGVHFPNTDEQWRNRPSVEFLTYTADLVRKEGWTIVNIDATVVAERPKVMAQAQQMRETIAQAAGCHASQISIKATTNERLGSIGRQEGLAAFAIATIREG